MSAFIVSDNHISALVYAAIHGATDRQHNGSPWYSIYFGNPSDKACSQNGTKLGAMLLRENVLSVGARYRQEHNPANFQLYKYDERRARRLTTIQLLKAIQCYEYQSCEHDGWTESYSHRFCQQLKGGLIHGLPGYDAAEWEIVDPQPAPIRVTATIVRAPEQTTLHELLRLLDTDTIN